MKSAIILTPLMGLLEKNLIEFKNVIEFGAMLENRKQVMRLVIPANEIDAILSFIKCYYPHIHMRISTFFLEDVFQTHSYDRFQRRVSSASSSSAERVLFLGKKQAVDEAWEIEETDCTDNKTSQRYGYPQCCGLAYQKYVKAHEGGWIEHYLSSSKNYECINFTSNRISTLVSPWLGYHYDYFPCGPPCVETGKINNENRQMLESSDVPEFVELVDRHVTAAVILHDGSVWYVQKEKLNSAGQYNPGQGLQAFVKSPKSPDKRLSHFHLHEQGVDAVIDGCLLSTNSDAGFKVINYV